MSTRLRQDRSALDAARERDRTGDFRRLKVAGVALPILFLAALELIRLTAIERDIGGYGFHGLLAISTVLAVIAFSFVMFHFIQRAQEETDAVVADLRRRQREGHGFYDVLLRVSNREALGSVLAAVARHARDLLGGDEATICLDEATTRSVVLDAAHAGGAVPRDGACISPEGEDSYGVHGRGEAAAVRAASQPVATLQVPIRSLGTRHGELWVGRSAPRPFSKRDRRFLSTLSDIASIAVASAQMRESERQGAILAERERIARELHDSLAQVLGATHLRLRALGAHRDALGAPGICAELAELADACEEGYHDVREAILELHESSQADRGLLDSLRAYLDKYSAQCGIAASLQTELDGELDLPPRSEIQIIRVVQEALTNVRKHSGAASASVRISAGEGAVRFTVEDNGRGFDAARALLDRDGFGLHSMRERMELIGGTLLTDSGRGRGTRVVAELPLPARPHHDRLDVDATVA